jgi:hypothetical protein
METASLQLGILDEAEALLKQIPESEAGAYLMAQNTLLESVSRCCCGKRASLGGYKSWALFAMTLAKGKTS